MSSRTWVSCGTTARPWSPSRICTWTRRRCGRWTTCAGCPRCRARTCCSTRCPTRNARRSSPTTTVRALPAVRLRPNNTMGEKHRVRFEPVGVEIEVDEDQTILRAAAEQGVMLMHGCKEGQCAACKSFVLEGDMDDIDLERYSTFALPDYEKEEGQTLLCRAHAYSDLVIELLQYDEEIIRNGLPLKKGVAEVVSNES